MPIRGVFMETSSMPSPDLSLRISPPRTSSPSSTPDTDHDLGLDLLQRIEALKPQADTCSHFASCTDLSLTLSSPSATSEADRRPWRWQGPFQDRWHNGHLISEMVSDGPRPIKGIPIYNGSTSPFLSADPKNMGFNHQMSSVPSLWSSFGSSLPCSPSSSSSGCYSSNLDTTTSFLHPVGLLPSMGSSHHPMMAPPTRFTGLSSDTGKYYHHHLYGIGPLDVSRNMMMRSRFMQKLPAKRSTVRAPRMRWTSTLHARFVHAVELLGGHESMLYILISIAISCYI